MNATCNKCGDIAITHKLSEVRPEDVGFLSKCVKCGNPHTNFRETVWPDDAAKANKYNPATGSVYPYTISSHILVGE